MDEDKSDHGVVSLPSKVRERPPLLGIKLDRCLQDMIKAMHSRGTPIGTSATGRAILLKHDKRSLSEFGGSISLGKDWAKSVLRRMGFTKRRANSKSKVLPEDFLGLKETFLLEMDDVPSDLIINCDQTSVKLVPLCSWTMEKKGTKCIEVSGVDDKHQITGVFLAAHYLENSFLFNLFIKEQL